MTGFEYFCLDNISYHGRTLTMVWDKNGQRYGRGVGLRVFADGKVIATAEKLGCVMGTLLSPTPLKPGENANRSQTR